jgi:hypothetical protein
MGELLQEPDPDRLERLLRQAGHTAPQPETEDEFHIPAQAGEGGSY